ncbi:MAG: glycosyltransferase family 2 protein [Candidatus Aminicenantes bacterium]|nr:MAG: glycosyltransferase family 2 protein [Candidatus Aminicenantes bacterium]
MTDVDIIIVNHNTKDLLRQCIKSVYANTPKNSFEIIVIDNSSVDESLQMIKREFPDVKVIENKENLGFSKANNQGITAGRGRYVLLLNSDTLVLPSTLDIMKQFLHDHPDVGIVGSRTFYSDYTVQATARSFPTPINALFGRKSILTRLFPTNRFSRRYLTCFNQDYSEPFEVDWVAGSCLMVKRKMIDEIGLLDEGFWMYWEDADWCYRAKKKGWKVFCVPEAKIIHYEGMSSKKQSAKLIMEFHKSIYRYYRKHHVGSYVNPVNILALVGLACRAGIILVVNFIKKSVK